jgi:hypothetical protein
MGYEYYNKCDIFLFDYQNDKEKEIDIVDSFIFIHPVP